MPDYIWFYGRQRDADSISDLIEALDEAVDMEEQFERFRAEVEDFDNEVNDLLDAFERKDGKTFLTGTVDGKPVTVEVSAKCEDARQACVRRAIT